jgi:transposase InsO family protein/transposase-like protein
MRFTASEKMEIIQIVEQSELGVRRTLKELGIHTSTYYNWYNKYQEQGIDGLQPKASNRPHYWNRVPDEIRGKIVDLALEFAELSCRKVACKYTDDYEYFISESSVYRILKKAGLISAPSHELIRAADQFKDQTSRVNEMWQTDFTYFKIIGWGWYYLSTVLDDYSRYIISWELCSTMKAVDVKNTLNMALNHPNVSVEFPPKLLSDNGSCYISEELGLFLDEYHMQHVRGRPNHPQTQGKIERYHRTMKNVIKLENYYSPDQLRFRLKEFVDYYNHLRYHESLDNLTPADVYYGRKEEKLRKRKLCKLKTMRLRKHDYFRKLIQSVS